MEIKAQLNYLHIAPRKVRLVANLIRGMSTMRARMELEHLPKRSAGPVLKLLHSAIAGARHNFQLGEEGLFVKKVMVNSGPALKRFEPRAFGRAAPIRKRTSHIVIVLESKPTQSKAKISKKKVKPVVRNITSGGVGEEAGMTSKPERPHPEVGSKLKSPAFVRRIFRRKVI